MARMVLSVGAVLVAAFAADPNTSQAAQSPSQSSPSIPAQAVAQSNAGARDAQATPSEGPSGGKSDMGAETGSSAASPAAPKAQVVVVGKKPAKRVLVVDDTINDAQLKQILAKGYKPEAQVLRNEVLYCRVEREMGSRFEKKVCKTATHIHDDELNGKEETFRLTQTGPSDH